MAWLYVGSTVAALLFGLVVGYTVAENYWENKYNHYVSYSNQKKKEQQEFKRGYVAGQVSVERMKR